MAASRRKRRANATASGNQQNAGQQQPQPQRQPQQQSAGGRSARRRRRRRASRPAAAVDSTTQTNKLAVERANQLEQGQRSSSSSRGSSSSFDGISYDDYNPFLSQSASFSSEEDVDEARHGQQKKLLSPRPSTSTPAPKERRLSEEDEWGMPGGSDPLPALQPVCLQPSGTGGRKRKRGRRGQSQSNPADHTVVRADANNGIRPDAIAQAYVNAVAGNALARANVVANEFTGANLPKLVPLPKDEEQLRKLARGPDVEAIKRYNNMFNAQLLASTLLYADNNNALADCLSRITLPLTDEQKAAIWHYLEGELRGRKINILEQIKNTYSGTGIKLRQQADAK